MSEEFGSDYIVLTDEDGNEQEFEILDSLETDDARYIAFLPVPEEGEEEPDEFVILRVEPDESGEELLATIDDEDELERVYELFMKHMEELDGEDAE